MRALSSLQARPSLKPSCRNRSATLGRKAGASGDAIVDTRRGTRASSRDMRRLIRIYDTTLRDGTQGEGVSFSMEDKVRLASRLDAFGIHYIEGGWPGS